MGSNLIPYSFTYLWKSYISMIKKKKKMGYLISNLEQGDSSTEIKQNTTPETSLCVVVYSPNT